MTHVLSILISLAFAGIGLAQTPSLPDYFAFVLSEQAATPVLLGAKLPTQVLVFGKPVTTETQLQITTFTSAGSEVHWVNQPASTGEDWVQVAVLVFNRGASITNVTIRKLNPSEPVTVPLEGQPVERTPSQ